MPDGNGEKGSPVCRPIGRDRWSVNVGLEDLSSLNQRNLMRVEKILFEAATCAAGSTLEVELNSRHFGASFIGLLAKTDSTLRSHGGSLKIRNASNRVLQVLAACGLESWT